MTLTAGSHGLKANSSWQTNSQEWGRNSTRQTGLVKISYTISQRKSVAIESVFITFM